MKKAILIELDDIVIEKVEQQAKKEKRPRKNMIEELVERSVK